MLQLQNVNRRHACFASDSDKKIWINHHINARTPVHTSAALLPTTL